jgi:DNA-binding winged helix-turn-helix (wHTH) protein
MTNCAEAGVIHFDVFELDISSGELRTAGTLVSLQPQPFKVLALLAGHSGQAITRGEIRQQLWGTKTFVDFEGGLNFCIRQIRKALGEGERKPRYIETLHRRGYRFVAQVNRVGQTPVKSTVRLTSHPQPVSQHMPITLAVLPFSDLVFSPQPHCLAEGITELLITYFSTNSSLRVVSRTSTMKYKHTNKSLPRIGRELGLSWKGLSCIRERGCESPPD